MKLLYLVLLLNVAGINLMGQPLAPQTLWKAEAIYDTLDNKLPNEKLQRFMYFDNEHEISVLTIFEKLNMSNGEIIVSYMIEADNLEKQSDSAYKVKELAVDNFEIINKDSILYKKQKYHVGYKRIDVRPSLVTEAALMNFLESHSIRKYYEDGSPSDQIRTYKRTGQVHIQALNVYRDWESDYRIFSFEGFLFLKGITSAPMLIENIENEKIFGKEADYRFETKAFDFRKEKL